MYCIYLTMISVRKDVFGKCFKYVFAGYNRIFLAISIRAYLDDIWYIKLLWNRWLQGVLGRVSYCHDKHHDQKQLEEKRVEIQGIWCRIHGGVLLTGLLAPGLLSLLSYTIQDHHIPRSGTIHNWLGYPYQSLVKKMHYKLGYRKIL